MVDPAGMGHCDALNVEVSSMKIVKIVENVSSGVQIVDFSAPRCLNFKHSKGIC